MVNVFAMDELSREFAVAEKELDIQFAEIAYMEAMIDAKLKINMAKSELKVMCESTEDHAQGDLVYLYNEAAKEAEANGESIFVKAKNAVVNFFVTVWNSIQKVVTKRDTESFKKLQLSKEKMHCPMDIKFFSSAADESLQMVSSGKINTDKLLKAFGITAVTGIGLKKAIPMIKEKCAKKSKEETYVTKGEAATILQKLEGLFGKFIAPLKKFLDVKDTNGESEGTDSMSFFSIIGKHINNIISKLKSLLHLDVKDPDEVKSDIVDEEGKHVANNKPANVKDPNPAQIEQKE